MSGLVTLKFGSSVLRTESDYRLATHEVYREWRSGRRVVVVVSAMNGGTDRLLAGARAVAEDPGHESLASLLCTGERASAALMTLALDAAGLPVTLLDPADLGLLAADDPLDADPLELDVAAVHDALARHAVVVVPGFFGVDARRRPRLFGRGGSDLTAVFLAQRLDSACRLIKDVDGVFPSDPAGKAQPARYRTLTWEDAEALEAPVIQAKALRFARSHGVPIAVGALGSVEPTVVGADRTRLSPTAPPREPLRVCLLGLGTVGLGVHRLLRSMPDRFRIVSALVRRVDHHEGNGVPGEILTGDPATALAMPCDVVVEVMGGIDRAARLIRKSLRAGRHVVTANKAVLAEHGGELESRARESGVRLLHSAAVGGSVPVLEAVRRAGRMGRVGSVEGVLNGTCNFVLDRLAEGYELEAALREAREKGLAEADPTLDTDGTDAAQKLLLIARAAFGPEATGLTVTREGIDRLDADRVRAESSRGPAVRLVASIERTSEGLTASVEPRELPRDHPLAAVRNEENAVLIRVVDGPTIVLHGKGAGRWPTAEAVVADLLDLWRGSSDADPPFSLAARNGAADRDAVVGNGAGP